MRDVQSFSVLIFATFLCLKLVQNKRLKKWQHNRLRADNWKASGGRNMKCFSGFLKGACLRQLKRAREEA